MEETLYSGIKSKHEKDQGFSKEENLLREDIHE